MALPKFDSNRHSLGFTLIENLIIIFIIGILAAIAAPSFFDLLNRKKIEDATVKARGALQEAQREAIRQNRSCSVNVVKAGEAKQNGNTVKHPTLEGECLVLGDRTLKGVDIRRPNSFSAINFSYRGTTNSTGTMVFFIPNASTQQQCLVMAPGLGIMRRGDYSKQDFNGFSATNCRTRQ